MMGMGLRPGVQRSDELVAVGGQIAVEVALGAIEGEVSIRARIGWAAVEKHFPVVASAGHAADRRLPARVPELEDVGAVSVGLGFVDDHRPRLRWRRLSLCEAGGARPGHRLSRAGGRAARTRGAGSVSLERLTAGHRKFPKSLDQPAKLFSGASSPRRDRSAFTTCRPRRIPGISMKT